MTRLLQASVVALAAIGCLPVTGALTPAAAQEVVFTEGKIARLKSALKLNAWQEPYWRDVAAQLRQIIREQRREEPAAGLLQRVRNKASDLSLDALALRRIAAAARPLIAVLDEDQKRAGMAALQGMGLAALF